MTTAQQNASPGVYVSDDVGLEVTDGTYSRVQLGLLPTGGVGTYGLRIVSSDGTTVIIDGTSDMFKIASTGTLALNSAASSGETTATVTLTALGTYTIMPGLLSNISTNTSAQTGYRYNGQTRFTTFSWVAGSSGGATNIQMVGEFILLNSAINLTGASSGNAVVTLFANNVSPATYANTGMRYWVLVEAAL